MEIPNALQQLAGFVLVAICWGSTNPLIKAGSAGLDTVSSRHPEGGLRKWLAELWYLLTRWQYVLPLALNLSGSVVYYYTLGKADMSLAVPITNSLTFIFSLLTGLCLGEKLGGRDTWLGMCLVVAGVCICMSDDEFIAKIESHFALYRLNLRSSLITHVALGSWYRVEVYLVNEVGLFRRADIEPDGRVEIGCDLLKATTDDALTPLVVDTDYRLELRSPQSQSQSQSQNNAIGFLASGKAAFEYRVISTSAGTPILGDRYLRIYPTHLHKFPKQSRGSNGDFILPLVVGPLVLTKVSPYSGSLPSYTSAEDWPEGTEMVYQGYRLFDSTIAIHETWDAGIPGKIWDSALVMLGFLKRMAEEKPDRIRGKHIIDLSAGTGLLGLQIAASMVTDLPKQPGRVTITEVEEALGLIQENVLLNKHLKRTCDLQLRSLLWGDAKQARACGKADVIVASDVLYESEYFEDLVQTFVDLSTSDTRIYIGYKRRGFDAAEEDRFWSLCRAHFQVTLIETQDEDTEFVPPLAKHVHVQLFRLQQKTVQRQ